MAEIAIIGGSGFNQLPGLEVASRESVTTPYGTPSAEFVLGRMGANEFVFVPRHGSEHAIPPHQVNYRANIHALKTLGVKQIIAFAAVGGITAEFKPGVIVLPDQIIDYTWGREHTFFDGSAFADMPDATRHIDFSSPYSEALREKIIAAAKQSEIALVRHATHAVTQGPRLESIAEINKLEKDGADIVGMTGMPEAALARELNMEYAAIAIVVNPAAGRSEHEISMDMIGRYLKSGAEKGIEIVKHL